MEAATVTETLGASTVVDGTEYVILQKDAYIDADSFKIVRASVRASSSDQAIRQHLDTIDGDPAGVYVAVPARSWKPTKVAVQTQTRIVLEES